MRSCTTLVRPLLAILAAGTTCLFLFREVPWLLGVPSKDINVLCENGPSPSPRYGHLLPPVYDDDRDLNAPTAPLSVIPPLLHLQWKTRQLPEFAIEAARVWQRLHPTWRLVLWTDADLERLSNLALGSGVLGQTFNDLPVNIVRIDFMRYLILQLFGGIYADIDVIPLRSLEPVLRAHSCVLAREPEAFAISLGQGGSAVLASNVLMASRPGHPFWGFLMAQISERQAEENAIGRAGPLAVTAALRKYAAQQALLPPDSAVFLAPSLYFYPPLRPGGDAIHKDMLRKACLWPMRVIYMRGWSHFAHRVCQRFVNDGVIDWTLSMAHPRVFNGSFTQHNMFNSWNSESAKRQRYVAVGSVPSLRLTSPEDFLKNVTEGIGAFDREKKVLTLDLC